MVFPFLSVTAVALAAALFLGTRDRPVRAIAYSLLGTWTGFVIGALAGGLVDVVLGTGSVLPLVGHLGAVAGAFVGTFADRRSCVVA